jgi:hypothetical protein
MEQEIQKRIQICSQIGGQRGQNGVGLCEQEIQKRIQICSKIGGQRGQNGVGLWNKRYRKDTDMQLIGRQRGESA